MPAKESTKSRTQNILEDALKKILDEWKNRIAAAGGKGGGTPPPKAGGKRTSGGQGDDDFILLQAMLERIRKTLGVLVRIAPVVLPAELRHEFDEPWKIAEQILVDAINTLKHPAQRRRLLPALKEAGLTGQMLQMKNVSLNYQMDQIDKAILSYPKKGWREKLFGVVKPGLKVINSILRSFFKGLPGVEAVGEFKDHLEAGYEAGENLTEDREL